MSRIIWDAQGERLYEMGVKQGVLYPVQSESAKHTISEKEYTTPYTKAVPWNGLTQVSQSPDGAEPTDLYADNQKYVTLRSAETFGATVECYTYPDEFKPCNGEAELMPGVYAGQQGRKIFGMSYRTEIGNDTDGQEHGYKLHLVYGASVSPSEESYETINDSPEAITFSYEMSTTPVNFTDAEGKARTTAHLVINSTKFDGKVMKAIEDVLYGSETTEGYLPLPDEVVAILKNAASTEVAAG